jgi:hypothetical protein
MIFVLNNESLKKEYLYLIIFFKKIELLTICNQL